MANINKSKRPQVTTSVKGLQVADSPLNAVKLDLGLFILVGLVLFIFLESINISQGLRFLVLGVWAVSMLVWVIIKTRAIIKKTALQEKDVEQYSAEVVSESGDNSIVDSGAEPGNNTCAEAQAKQGPTGESHGAK